jgi:hypothetical protein
MDVRETQANDTYIFESKSSKTIPISPSIQISQVNNIQDFKIFFQIPWTIYNKNKYWVPPFWKDSKDFFRNRNPFWKHSECKLFIAFKDSKPVGRIATFIDRNLPIEIGKKVGYFGYFECNTDLKVALGLLKVAQDWLRTKGMDIIRGPINGRIDLGSGFLIKGFDTVPYLLGSHTPSYYNNFATEFGMKKARDLVSYHIDLTQPIPASVQDAAKHCREKNVKIRPFQRLHFKKEMKMWFALLHEIFSDHYGYTPASYEEMKITFGIKQLRWIIVPKLFLFAEIDGETVGFRFSLPDFNLIFQKLNGKMGFFGAIRFQWYLRNVTRGRFIVMGIKKKYRGIGIGSCMNYHTLLEMKRRGYLSTEYGWIDEDNISSRKAGEKIGGKLYKIYRIYEKDL